MSSVISSSMNRLMLEPQAKMLSAVFYFSAFTRRHIPGGEQQQRFVGFQLFGGVAGFRPPNEAALRQSFLRQPVSLAVVIQETDRGSATAAKYEYAAGEWIPSVDGLDGHQHAHLGRNLNHCSVPRQARGNAVQSGATLTGQWMRILPPRVDSNSITGTLGMSPAAAVR